MLEGSNKVITVGDATTERIISFGITPHLSITDGVERRSVRKRSIAFHAKEMFCANPPGTISEDALRVLERALEMSPPISVKVQGEEDLLALPLFIMAPKGSAVLYGQPLEGIVVVNITEEKKVQAKALMDRIFRIRDR
ncbi:MAG: GTP-dependent dephospho-CoA kinase family protein [Thermoproteota archaeon]|nr:GTP-dependent dephospho-CoA kinase family protein [Thermoproteota archaeon]